MKTTITKTLALALIALTVASSAHAGWGDRLGSRIRSTVQKTYQKSRDCGREFKKGYNREPVHVKTSDGACYKGGKESRDFVDSLFGRK